MSDVLTDLLGNGHDMLVDAIEGREGSELSIIVHLVHSSRLAQSNRKQTPSASILFFNTNLVYVLNINMQRKVRSRSVHANGFGTCKEDAAAQCQLQILTRVWPQNLSEVGTAQLHSLCKYRSHAQT